MGERLNEGRCQKKEDQKTKAKKKADDANEEKS